MNIEKIAELTHELNRIYCASIGDLSQPAWASAPDWQKQSAINGVKFHENALASGREPSPSESHDAWLKQKREEGWKYGPVKDAAKKEHPCFMPYDGLPVEQRMKDFLFSGVVRAFFLCEAATVATYTL